jgi:hypothetical protein
MDFLTSFLDALFWEAISRMGICQPRTTLTWELRVALPSVT